MVQAIRKHFPDDVEYEVPKGGLYVWARLPAKSSAGVKSVLFQRALKNDVLYVPGELCYAEDATRKKPANEMRISFGSAGEKAIEEGIRRLGSALKAK